MSASPEVLAQHLPNGEVIFLHLSSEAYFGLDPVGGRMYDVLVRTGSVQSANDALLEEFDVGPDQLRTDLGELVGNLVERGLLAFHAP